MRFLPPIPWRDVQTGTVVLDAGGMPRAVAANIIDIGDRRLVLLEGDPRPHYTAGAALVSPVELDESDAIGALYAAGLTPAPITTESGDQS